MANKYTEELTKRVAKDEGFKAERYTLGKEKYPTIGHGHLIDNESTYEILATQLGIKDKENLSDEEAKKLLKYDIDVKRREMALQYKGVPQELLDSMLNVRMQFSPQMFDKHFGEAIKKYDIDALKGELGRLGQVFKDRGMGGVKTRWDRVSTGLDDLKFDPEGEGFDYQTAIKGGMTTTIDPKDKKPHWGSRDPSTGQVLKGRKHETWDKAIEADKKMGYETIKGLDKRYYSVPVRR